MIAFNLHCTGSSVDDLHRICLFAYWSNLVQMLTLLLFVCITYINTGGGAVIFGADSTVIGDNATQVIISNCTFTDNIST
jgi:hypothetical protein